MRPSGGATLPLVSGRIEARRRRDAGAPAPDPAGEQGRHGRAVAAMVVKRERACAYVVASVWGGPTPSMRGDSRRPRGGLGSCTIRTRPGGQGASQVTCLLRLPWPGRQRKARCPAADTVSFRGSNRALPHKNSFLLSPSKLCPIRSQKPGVPA